MSLVVQCSSDSSASPLTATTSAFHVLTARRRSFPRAATIIYFATPNELQTHEGYDENPSTDRETIAANAQKF